MQGMTSRDEVRQDILRMAISRTELRFSDVIEALKGKHSRATVNRYLRELVDDGLMMEKPASSKERFRPRYFITPKGRKHILLHSLESINDNLKNIQNVISFISTQDKIEEWKKGENQFFDEIIKESMTDEKRLDRFEKEYRGIFEPLLESFSALHGLVCQCFLRPKHPKGNFAIAPLPGGLFCVPAEEEAPQLVGKYEGSFLYYPAVVAVLRPQGSNGEEAKTMIAGLSIGKKEEAGDSPDE